MAVDYNSSSEIAALLKLHGLHLSKRFGQNFLISDHHRRAIVDALDIQDGETVWEIGPGIGALTHILMQKPVKLSVFEIDRGFIPLLKQEFGDSSKCSIIEGDFLKTWKNQWEQSPPDKIIGNLPYNVGSIIIGDLVKNDAQCKRMVFTLQKEVVDRITAKSSTKDFSAFSLMCQYKWKCRKIGTVPRQAFFPVPEVTSAYLSMEYDSTLKNDNRVLYDIFVNDVFNARRKTIRNNLKKGKLQLEIPYEKILEACLAAGIDPGIRGETLKVDDVKEICEKINRQDILI